MVCWVSFTPLRRTIEGIKWKRTSEVWDEYADVRTYEKEDISRKSEYVERVVKRLKPEVVWDLGSNTGEFSLIAAAHGAFVVSIDGDPGCTEYLYQKVAGDKGVKGVLPLTMDLANPSPGLGWDSQERPSLKESRPCRSDICPSAHTPSCPLLLCPPGDDSGMVCRAGGAFAGGVCS